jgi:TonB family protein
MAKNSLDQFFDDLLSGSRAATAMARRQARAALLTATPQNEAPAAVADIAAHLDTALNSGGDGISITRMACDQDAIYELESAQSYLDRMSGEEQPVPATLLRLIGAAPAAHTVAPLPEMPSRPVSLRREPLVFWVGAAGAILLAGIIGYTVHDLVGRGESRIASALPAFAPEKKQVFSSRTAPPHGLASPAAPRTYTTVNTPIPITPHTVSAGDYPPESIQSLEQGTVKVKYLVLKDGTVGECQVEISSSFSRLDDAACVLVRRWLFRPATVMGGSPVEYWLDTSIAFQLK